MRKFYSSLALRQLLSFRHNPSNNLAGPSSTALATTEAVQ